MYQDVILTLIALGVWAIVFLFVRADRRSDDWKALEHEQLRETSKVVDLATDLDALVDKAVRSDGA